MAARVRAPAPRAAPARGVRRAPARAHPDAAPRGHAGERARRRRSSPRNTARRARRSRRRRYEVLLSYPAEREARDRRRARRPSRPRRGADRLRPRHARSRRPRSLERVRALGRRRGGGRLRQPRQRRGLRPPRPDGRRRAGQDRPGALLRRLPGRQVPRGREDGASPRILVYSDPIDDGWFQGAVYPEGPWGPSSHFQRGANVYDFIVPGRPPDARAGRPPPGARRIAEAESEILPEDPDDAPLGAGRGRDPAAPDGPARAREAGRAWRSRDTYRVGARARARLRSRSRTPARSGRSATSSARSAGTDEPDRKSPPLQPLRRVGLWRGRSLLGHGHDDLARPRARLARAEGLAAPPHDRLRLVGRRGVHADRLDRVGRAARERTSTQNARRLHQRGRLDARAADFSASASPLLFAAHPRGRARRPRPGPPGQERRRLVAGERRRQRTPELRDRRPAGEELPVAILGSGSDYTVFFNRLGIASTDLLFDGPYGVYHSVYDDYALDGDRSATRASCTTRRWRATRACSRSGSPTPTSSRFDAARLRRRDRALRRGAGSAPGGKDSRRISRPRRGGGGPGAVKRRRQNAARSPRIRTDPPRQGTWMAGMPGSSGSSAPSSTGRSAGPSLVPAPRLRAAALLRSGDPPRRERGHRSEKRSRRRTGDPQAYPQARGRSRRGSDPSALKRAGGRS